MSKNLKQYFSRKYFFEYCSQIKIYFIISTLIFVLSMIIGWVFSDLVASFVNPAINQMSQEVATEGMIFTEIFSNNLQADFLTMVSGLFFSIISLFGIIYNGMIIGYILGTSSDLLFVILLIVPHGIFEIPASILSLSVALMITHLCIRCIKGIFYRSLTLTGEILRSKSLINAVIISAIVIFILLVIAAFIEVYVTEGVAIAILKFLAFFFS